MSRIDGTRLEALLGTLLVLAVMVAAAPAAASVVAMVEVTTSIAVPEADEDGTALMAAVRSAVDDVIRETVAFTPTLVVVTRAVVVRGRLYLHVLLANQEGERAFREFAAPPDDDREPAPGSETRL